MTQLVFFVLAFLCLAPVCKAQKIVKVAAEYTYVAPSDVSPEQAKTIAFERARLTALADEFGTIISQDNSTVAVNENGKSVVDFLSLSSSHIKGEWLETLEEKVMSAYYDMNAGLIITVKVVGKARAVKRAQIDIVAKILRNGTDIRAESEDFHHEDDLYLYFRSPAKGNLAVYLSDETKNVYCLLPYRRDTDGKVDIGANRDYVFFSPEMADADNKNIVEQYMMLCDKPIEFNQMFIIFSTNAFVKANDYSLPEECRELPRQLPFDDFQKWLSKVRTEDRDMVVLQKSIKISK